VLCSAPYQVQANSYAFTSDSYTFTTINAGGSITQPWGISDTGQIVGSYYNTTNHGFLYNGGSVTTIDVPGATVESEAFGINDAGQIVGFYQDATGGHGFLYSGGSFRRLICPAPLALPPGVSMTRAKSWEDTRILPAPGFLNHPPCSCSAAAYSA